MGVPAKPFSAAVPAAGVMILFNNKINFQISRTYCDPEGHFIICDMTTNGKQLTLVNLYAPNDDDPNFFTSVFEHLADFQSDEVIIGARGGYLGQFLLGM